MYMCRILTFAIHLLKLHLPGCEGADLNAEMRGLYQCPYCSHMPKLRFLMTRMKYKEQGQMSRVIRNQRFCICENKDADQLRGNREADQRLCFSPHG